MKRITIYLFSFVCCLILATCNNWLDTEPNTILTEDQVWENEDLINGVLANLYARIPAESGLEESRINGHVILDDAMWSGIEAGFENINKFNIYPYDWFYAWDYTLIRDINLALENCRKAQLPDMAKIPVLEAEFRFIRAQVYFEMVRRMGGVPIITETYTYTPGMDITTLQSPRAKEHEVYDFIIKEAGEIKDALAANNKSKSRASQYAALALKARAGLYAASIAKYSQLRTPEIANALSSGEVAMAGINPVPYYAQALADAETIINDGVFQLMNSQQTSDNFYNAVCVKDGNTEVILARDYSGDFATTFTYMNLAPSQRETPAGGSGVTPSLNLVEAYEYRDGAAGNIKTVDAGGNYIFYDSPSAPFANKDLRLAGTVLYPGSSFKTQLSIQAGVYYWSGRAYAFSTGGELGSSYTDGGVNVGADGPQESNLVTNTGFYLRKYVDKTGGAGSLTSGSAMWWSLYRMGEVYLNAAEAAFELNKKDIALKYLNPVRNRAGLKSLTEEELTFEKIQNERRCELAFEDHRIWDAKRWRIAHEIWDGSEEGTNSAIYALYPYRVVGGEHNGKYIFVKKKVAKVLPHQFRIGSYYTAIAADVLSSNPKLVRNPLQ